MQNFENLYDKSQLNENNQDNISMWTMPIKSDELSNSIGIKSNSNFGEFMHFQKDLDNNCLQNIDESICGLCSIENNNEDNKKITIEIPKFVSLIEESKKDEKLNLFNINQNIKVKNSNNININKYNNGILTKNESIKSTKFITKLFKNEININIKKHSVFSEDNISIKIRSHFLNFCDGISTNLLVYLKDNYKNYYEIEEKFKEKNIVFKKFFKLNHKFKSTSNKSKINDLKKKTLFDIMNQEISSKLKKLNKKNNNEKICEIIKENELLREIFSIKYEILFDIYYKNKYIINIKQLNLNKEIISKYQLNNNIILSKNIKMFKDLLENNSTCEKLKKQNIDLAKKYKYLLKECVIKNYSSKVIFLVNEQ